MRQLGHTQKLKVLFLCTGNSCRSQLAEGWAKHLKTNQLEAYAAGVETLVLRKSSSGSTRDPIEHSVPSFPNQCNGKRPIRSFLDGLTRPTAVKRLPDENTPADQIADEMAELLTTTLLASIQETCDDIVIE